MVDDGSDFGVGRVELVVVLAVGIDEVGGRGPTLIYHKIPVDYDRNIVLRIELEIEVKELKMQSNRLKNFIFEIPYVSNSN